jgi:hypothetical protein
VLRVVCATSGVAMSGMCYEWCCYELSLSSLIIIYVFPHYNAFCLINNWLSVFSVASWLCVSYLQTW